MSKEQENRTPLLQSLLQYENVRTAQLLAEGSCQRNYPKSNDGWMKTMFVLEGRALDLIAVPLTLLVLHAIVYTLLTKLWLQRNDRAMESWEMFFSLVINTTLSFLLVFRLNRAADRFWSSRTLWGLLIARARAFSACIIAHTSDQSDCFHRDEAIRWIVASVIASMELLRGVKELPVLNFAGILSKDEVYRLSANTHPPIYAFDEARYHINAIFRVTEHTPVGMAQMQARHLTALETHVDMLLECCGGLERIRGTPLPIVYVAHLRTFIVFALLFFPYLWGPSWGWATIPIVTASAFAWLGIDGAAAEAEAPFRQNRVNALDMNSYCLGYLEVVKQQLLNHAERLAIEQG